MSSATTRLVHSERAVLLTPKIIFWAKLTAFIAFGALFLVDSLYFALCHITFDFFGARNSPFFGWLRLLSSMMQVLYFPALCAALLCIDIGAKRREARRLAFVFAIAHIAVGTLLLLFSAKTGLWGWALLFGPSVQTIVGALDQYTQAVAGLIPLAWISAIHVITSLRSSSRQVTNSLTLSSFWMAGLTVSLLYMGAARIRQGASDPPFTLSALSFSVAMHLAVATLLFLALQGIRLAANRCANPSLVQFVLRALVMWVLLAVLVRKILFALLSFNDNRANIYAVLFSLTVVLFTAGVLLRIREERPPGQEPEIALRRSWVSAVCALLSATVFFYIFSVKFVSMDWEHVVSSVASLFMWGFILWFFLGIRRPARSYRAPGLAALAIVALGGLVGLQAMASKEPLAGSLEQYSDYDPSFFAIQQTLKPMVQEDGYSAWYHFLADHANIRKPVDTPDQPLSEGLRPATVNRPNIFMFVIDALRQDYISAYNPAVTFTPGFDAFARESIVFQHAYSTYAGTDLAVTAIASGLQQLNKIFPEPVTRFNQLQVMLNLDGYDCYTSYNPIVAIVARKSDHITDLSRDLGAQYKQDFPSIVRKLEDAIVSRADQGHPLFVYSQPANVHTLSLTWHRGEFDIQPHPGFDDGYASSVERVDAAFGDFIAFLKREKLYDNSVVIVMADHGESLGEMGRHGHTNYLTPEIIQVPLLIHLPRQYKSDLIWDVEQPATLHDITPTLYYLLGHRPLRGGDMIGHSLFAMKGDAPVRKQPDHYFLMSSYMPVFGVLTGDRKNLFFVDAVLRRSFYYDLEHDPHALRKRMTVPIREHYESIIRQDLEAIDKFYGVKAEALGKSQP